MPRGSFGRLCAGSGETATPSGPTPSELVPVVAMWRTRGQARQASGAWEPPDSTGFSSGRTALGRRRSKLFRRTRKLNSGLRHVRSSGSFQLNKILPGQALPKGASWGARRIKIHVLFKCVSGLGCEEIFGQKHHQTGQLPLYRPGRFQCSPSW